MMNANVRRLVFDLTPRALGWASMVYWILIGVFAAMWASGYTQPNVLMANCVGIWVMLGTGKIQIWRVLPVSQSELRQAQYWQGLGIPYFVTAVCALIGIGAAGATGHLKVSPVEILAFLSAESLLIFTMGGASLLRTLLDQTLGKVGSTVAAVIPLLFATGLALVYVLGRSSDTLLQVLIWLGALTLVLCLAALAWNQKLPLTLPEAPILGRRQHLPVASPRGESSADRSPVRPTGFWTLFGSSLQRVAPFAGVMSGIVAILVLTMRYGPLGGVANPTYLLAFTPLLCPIVAMVGYLMESHRVVGGLPVSAFKRSIALQGLTPALLAPTWAFMIALGALANPEAMTFQWWLNTSLNSLIAMALGAVAVPIQLRFGPRFIVIFLGFVAATWAGLLAGFSDRAAYQRCLDHWGPVIVGVLILTILSGWIWTYVELGYGRRAYRTSPLAAATWRGAPS